MKNAPKPLPELKYLNFASDLLDSRFRVPRTNLRFGLDFLIGLVPYIGDVITFVFSGMLIITMAKKGVSGMVVVKMVWNIFLDATVGAIPILGDLFDLHYKANRRNYNLLVEHYEEGEHQGSAWPIVIGLILVLLLLLFMILTLTFWIFIGIAELIQVFF